jgi:hypothetical protein
MTNVMSQTEIDWFQDYIDSVRWKEAKSMPNVPHSYTIREWKPDTFEQAVMIIRTFGVSERFYSKSYTYLYWGDYKYWTMGEPLEETIIINRAGAETHYGNGKSA